MEAPIHSLTSLFDQLGLGSSEEDINNFINANKALPKDIPLYNASFWSQSQAAFLRQAIADDADWAEVVDQLNAMLR